MFDPEAIFELSERTTLEFDSGVERTGRRLAVEGWNGPFDRNGRRGYEVTTADGRAFVPAGNVERINKLGLSNQKKNEIHRTACEHRREGNFVEAGHAYTRTAFHVWATYETLAGIGFRRLLEAVTCYRLGGRSDLCENRCRIGVRQAELYRDRWLEPPMPDYPPDHANGGGWSELIAAFRLVGGLGGVDEAYTAAKQIYRDAGDPYIEYADEGPVHNHTVWFDSIAGELGRTESHEIGGYEMSYTEWADYKRARLPEFIDELVEHGEWWTARYTGNDVLPEY